MNKEIAQLIKTLNGGLQHLPDLAKQMVNQYVVGHAVIGATILVIAIALGFICFKTACQVKERLKEKTHSLDDIKKERSINDKKMDELDDQWQHKLSSLFDNANPDHDLDKSKILLKRRFEVNDSVNNKMTQYLKRDDILFKQWQTAIDHQNEIWQRTLPFLYVSIFTGVGSFAMLLISLKMIYQALTPIWSIIQALR